MDMAALRRAWASIAYNHDHAISRRAARQYLLELNANRFTNQDWRVALRQRRQEYPEFFARYDYSWCDDASAYDFPNEPFYQVRAIIAAIGLWLADIWDKPANLDLAGIVARSTYLWRLNEVTPHVQQSNGITFLVCPLGWTAFLHTFFAAFAQWRDAPSIVTCEPDWLGIAANLIASSVPGTDFSMVAMTDSIINQVREFSTARHGIKKLPRTSLSSELVYGTEEFALCHEIAHVGAEDLLNPNESRADRWALAAYVHSWELRPALYLDIASFDPIREVIGPFAFFCALRSLLAARAIIARRLGLSDADRAMTVWRQLADRSLECRQLLRDWLGACVSAENIEGFTTQVRGLESLLNQLTDYETTFVDRLSLLSAGACALARKVAEDAARDEPDAL